MGRCYDFGISIDASSELAMVVAPEGGYCLCPSTGTTCGGRFAGCDEIIAQAGRIPANAPKWSVPQQQLAMSEVAAAPEPPAFQPNPPQPVETVEAARVEAIPAPPEPSLREALETADEQREPDAQAAVLDDITASIESLRGEVANLTEKPQTAAIDDVAEAVVLLQSEIAESTTQIAQLGAMLGGLTEVVDAMGGRHEAPTYDADRDVQVPLETLGRAMIEVRNAQKATSKLLSPIRDALDESSQHQAGELRALRREIAEINNRMMEQRSADLSDEELAGALGDIRVELVRLRPESQEMVGATQLANTVNTLRDAGVEDLSAAHLVHALQVDMQTMREELQRVRRGIEAISSGPGAPTSHDQLV